MLSLSGGILDPGTFGFLCGFDNLVLRCSKAVLLGRLLPTIYAQARMQELMRMLCMYLVYNHRLSTHGSEITLDFNEINYNRSEVT
jgi:hypothetical protein